MKKGIYLSGVVVLWGVMVGSHLTNAADKAGPLADSSKMMFEHVDMDCTLCHGENGPKGIEMGNYSNQKCTDCHSQGAAKAKKTPDQTRTKLSQEMMLKHGAALNCKLCHGENGTNGMILEHVGMDCQACHRVEAR